jgi:hypothetical protein
MPRVPAERTIGLSDLPAVLRGNAAVRAGITMTFLVITSHFMAYMFRPADPAR